MTKGQRLRLLRERKGLTQSELADKLRTTKQTISKYEKDIVTNIPSDRVEELATILNSTPEYILGWEDKLTEKDKKKNDTLSDIVVRMRNDQFLFEAITKLAQLDNETLASAVKLLDNPELIQTAAHITELDEVKKAGIKAMVSTFLKQFQDEIQK